MWLINRWNTMMSRLLWDSRRHYQRHSRTVFIMFFLPGGPDMAQNRRKPAENNCSGGGGESWSRGGINTVRGGVIVRSWGVRGLYPGECVICGVFTNRCHRCIGKLDFCDNTVSRGMRTETLGDLWGFCTGKSIMHQVCGGTWRNQVVQRLLKRKQDMPRSCLRFIKYIRTFLKQYYSWIWKKSPTYKKPKRSLCPPCQVEYKLTFQKCPKAFIIIL